MTEGQRPSLHEGLLAASEDLGAVAERYGALGAEVVLSPGERRRINEVAEAIRIALEKPTPGSALVSSQPLMEGLPAPLPGEVIPLPPKEG
jgi:hypothetical protein